MTTELINLQGNIHFKIRFNTAHSATDLFWRVIIDETEYLVRSVLCKVDTFSEASFDKKAEVIKYHMAGVCNELAIDESLNAVFK